MYICVYVYRCMCVCVCVEKEETAFNHLNQYILAWIERALKSLLLAFL